MRSKLILAVLVLLFAISGYGKTWKITNNYYSYNPASITINYGDTVVFEISASHDVREVSQTAWNNNANTALENGFQLPFGGGMLLPEKLVAGTHYYVCTPHAAFGMKGTIIVQDVASGINNRLISNLSVYPNPAKDFIQVKTESALNDIDYTITNIFGKRVQEGKLENSSSLVEIKDLLSGVYIIQVGKSSGQNYKFIKK